MIYDMSWIFLLRRPPLRSGERTKDDEGRSICSHFCMNFIAAMSASIALMGPCNVHGISMKLCDAVLFNCSMENTHTHTHPHSVPLSLKTLEQGPQLILFEKTTNNIDFLVQGQWGL